ncbi:MAG: ABC transporter ATP-binding protein [Fimbriimonas sp.]
MVQTEGICKTFTDPKRGEIKAVDHISIAGESGKILGLLGKNGAGKSTLLRMLSTIIKPTAGRATVAGYDVVTQAEQVRASIGFMSNSTALYGRLTAREMIEYFGGLYGILGPELKRRTDAVIERLDIGSYSNQLCDKLSTGQKQRVNIARTILHDPPVMFFDEPTAGLDVVMSQDVMQFIEESRDSGKTVVYCTHIMSEVERLCDHVVVIHDGMVKGEGTVEQLKLSTGQPSLEKAFLQLAGVLQGVAK